MASRSGGAPIRTNKVRSGPDQTFTLQKGVSAAPLKGPGMGVRNPLGKPSGKTLGKPSPVIGPRTVKGKERKHPKQVKKSKFPFTAKELAIAAAAYSLGATGDKYKTPAPKGKTLSQIETAERKKKDRATRYERLLQNPARTGGNIGRILLKKPRSKKTYKKT